LGVGRGNERSGKLRTSKEHPRNMLATCLELLHCLGGAKALADTPRPPKSHRKASAECGMRNGEESQGKGRRNA